MIPQPKLRVPVQIPRQDRLKRCPRCKQPKPRTDFVRAGYCKPCMYEYQKPYVNRCLRKRNRERTDAKMTARLLKEQNAPSLQERLRDWPKHPLVKDIPQVERHKKKPFFWYLPPDLRKQAWEKYHQKYPTLQAKWGLRIPQIAIAGLVGGITKMLLYPDQKVTGHRGKLCAAQSKRQFREWLERKKNERDRAKFEQDQLERNIFTQYDRRFRDKITVKETN